MRRISAGDDLSDLGAELRTDPLVGVDRENPMVFGGFDSEVPLRRDRRVPKDEHPRPECLRARHRVVGRPAVDDDHLVGPGEIGQGGGNLCALVERRNDHTYGRSGADTPVRDVSLNRVLRE